jgi:hypothetical protein
MTFDFKTATPDTSLDANAFVFGADTQASASPSIYQLSVLKTFMSDSPTLVTPTLGVATATSINKVALTAPATGSTLTIADGKTLTASNTLTFTGTDGSSVAFGTGGTVAYTGNKLSVFAATTSAELAGVISDETGSGALVFANSPTFTDDITLGTQQTTAGSIILANTAAGAFATTIQGSGSATEAWTLTLPPDNGTNGYVLQTDGTGVTSWVAGGGGVTIDTTAITSGTAGRLLFESATNKVTESSLLSFDNTNGALSVGGATVTTSNPVLNLTQTWNAGAVTFTGLKFNVTDTASASASLLIDLQVGGSSKFKVDKAGNVTAVSDTVSVINATSQISLNNTSIGFTGSAATLANNIPLGWSSSGVWYGTADTILTRSAAATLQMGAAAAASPVAQTLQAQGSRAGTDTNTAGGNLTIQSGNGTGTATPSILYLKSPIKVGSGTGAQTQTTGLAINVGTAVLSSYTVATLPAAADAGAGAMAFVTDANATTARSTVAGGGANKVIVFSDATNWLIAA